MSSKECAYCNGVFQFKRRNAKFCSGNCKQMAYYKRHGLVLGSAVPFSEIAEDCQPQINKGSSGFVPVIIKDTFPPILASSPMAEVILSNGTRLYFYQPIDSSFLRDLLN